MLDEALKDFSASHNHTGNIQQQQPNGDLCMFSLLNVLNGKTQDKLLKIFFFLQSVSIKFTLKSFSNVTGLLKTQLSNKTESRH